MWFYFDARLIKPATTSQVKYSQAPNKFANDECVSYSAVSCRPFQCLTSARVLRICSPVLVALNCAADGVELPGTEGGRKTEPIVALLIQTEAVQTTLVHDSCSSLGGPVVYLPILMAPHFLKPHALKAHARRVGTTSSNAETDEDPSSGRGDEKRPYIAPTAVLPPNLSVPEAGPLTHVSTLV